jgi:hypothetical protein
MLSGRRLDLLDPSPSMSNCPTSPMGWHASPAGTARHGDHAFSVAQHSLVVEEIFRRMNRDARPTMPDGAACTMRPNM